MIDGIFSKNILYALLRKKKIDWICICLYIDYVEYIIDGGHFIYLIEENRWLLYIRIDRNIITPTGHLSRHVIIVNLSILQWGSHIVGLSWQKTAVETSYFLAGDVMCTLLSYTLGLLYGQRSWSLHAWSWLAGWGKCLPGSWVYPHTISGMDRYARGPGPRTASVGDRCIM